MCLILEIFICPQTHRRLLENIRICFQTAPRYIHLFPETDIISLEYASVPSSPRNIHLFPSRVVVSWNWEQVVFRKWRVLEMMHLFPDIALKVHFLEKGNRYFGEMASSAASGYSNF